MASLTGQSISSSYEQLLSLPDGGLNGTTLVAITDGDSSTEVAFKISTNALSMNSTNQLQFGDTGTYIHQSADGVLDLVSDTEIEINATTIDMNGALDLSGNALIGGNVGIGTGSDTIDATLHVKGGTANTVKFQSASGATNISLTDSSDSLVGQLEFGASGSQIVTRTSSTLSLGSNNVQTLHITDDDNVGIGTSSFWAGETTAHTEISATKAGDYAGLILRNENTDAGDSVSLNFGLARDGGLNFGNAGKILVGKEADFTTTPSTVDSFMAFHTILDETSSEKMRLTSGGSLGIGGTPTRKLSVFGSAYTEAGGADANIFLSVANSSWSGMALLGGTSQGGFIDFGDTDAVHRGRILYSHANDNMQFNTSAVTRFILDANSRISLSNNDGGSNNTTFGYQSGLNLTTNGDENVLVGHASGVELTTGEHNVAVGHKSIFDFKEGSYNTAVGSFSLGGSHGSTADASAENVAIGYSAMGNDFNNSNTTDQCVAIGAFAMNGALSGVDGSVAVGYKSLKSLVDGGNCTAVGFHALEDNVSGFNNTAVGYQSLTNATGGGNSSVGSQAGDLITSGTNNTLLGSASEVSANSATNQAVIGQGATGQADNSVTLGNADVTAVYMAQDSGATIYANGINFPDDAATDHSADVNTLDNYEEGTYTPVVSNGSSNYSASTASGHYTVIGQEVFVQVYIVSSEAGSGGTLQVTLPFNYNAGGNAYITATPRFSGLDLGADCVQLMLGNSSSGTSNLLFFQEQKDDAAHSNLSASAYSSGDTILFNVHYKIA